MRPTREEWAEASDERDQVFDEILDLASRDPKLHAVCSCVIAATQQMTKHLELIMRQTAADMVDAMAAKVAEYSRNDLEALYDLDREESDELRDAAKAAGYWQEQTPQPQEGKTP